MNTSPETTPPETTTAAVATSTPSTPPVRIRTVVVGLAAIAIGIAVVVSRLTDTHVDGGIVALLVVLTTGAVMLGTGITNALRSRRQ